MSKPGGRGPEGGGPGKEKSKVTELGRFNYLASPLREHLVKKMRRVHKVAFAGDAEIGHYREQEITKLFNQANKYLEKCDLSLLTRYDAERLFETICFEEILEEKGKEALKPNYDYYVTLQNEFMWRFPIADARDDILDIIDLARNKFRKVKLVPLEPKE